MSGRWDGQDRRTLKRDNCCTDFESRVSKLEAFRQTQERDIDRLVDENRATRKELAKTNENLAVAVNKMTEIRTTQRNTHVFVGSLGAVLATAAEFAGRKLFGG